MVGRREEEDRMVRELQEKQRDLMMGTWTVRVLQGKRKGLMMGT
jgi:hypothetical protein